MSDKSKVPFSQRRSWRDVLPIHPAADRFPPITAEELRELGTDIVKNGLTSSIALWRADPKSPAQLLDGRNRLDAIEIATGKPVEVGAPSIMAGDFLACDKAIELDGRKVDPVAYVISANIHRRHLTIEDKDRLIVELLKADPTKSNRQVAKIIDASHPHVAEVRRRAEKAGDVETVTTSIDTRGRKQSARRKTAKPKAAPSEDKPKARDDIGPASTGEVARKDVEIEELRNAKRQLEIKITGLESEIEELRAARHKRLEQLIAERGTWENKPLPPLNLARLPLDDQLIILIGLLENGLAPARNLVAALELPANASVKRRVQLEHIEAMVGAVFNWMSTTKDYVAEIKQALDDYASTTASTAPPTTTPPDIQPPADDGLGIPEFLDRTKQTEITS